MSQAIVNNVVPNNLQQFRHVNTLKSGRTQVVSSLAELEVVFFFFINFSSIKYCYIILSACNVNLVVSSL